jgi:hypothetical protein
MSQVNREGLRSYVEKWRRAGPDLERIHRDELRKHCYDPVDADALLELGDSFKESRPTSGLVEMQKWFMKLAERQGLKAPKARRKGAARRAGTRAKG